VFDRIVAISLRSRLAVVIGSLVVAAWGVYAFRHLNIEAFPDPTDTQVNIITLYPGQPSEELERQVSIPIERVVNGTPGLARLRSINLFGLSFITLTFQDGVDVYFARQQTLERIRLAELPAGVVPQLGSLSTPIGEIYRYTLTGPDRDPLRLRTLQDWVVRPMLLRVEGVADVVSYGGLVREIHVRPDPHLLAARGLTLRELEEALRTASVNASGGILERGAEQLVIRSQGIFSTVADIKQVAVASREGTPILVADVASVQEGWAPRQGVVGRGGDEDAVEGIVLMRRGENPSAVLARLREKVDEINARYLPAGTRISAFYDRTELVETTLRTVGRNLLEGAILVVLVLFAFLLDLRAALIVSALIPLALLSSFIYLRSRGMAANLLSMGAVDFGIIVDGAVVIVESIVRHEANAVATPEPLEGRLERIRRAVGEVARPTMFALLIIIAAYLPIFLLERVEGRIFAPMAHTVVSALLGSLVFSITLVPVLATFAYRRPARHRESPLLRWFAAAYRPTLRAALRWPAAILGLAIALLAFAGYKLQSLGSEFLPELNEGALYLTFTLPSNVSRTEGRRMTSVLARLIEGFPQVEEHLSQLGRPEDGTDPKLANNLEFFVKLRPESEWPRDTPNLAALVKRMSDAFAAIPGLEVNFSQPIRDNVNDNISGQVGQIALKIYHHDVQELQQVAEEAKKVLAGIPGVADLGIVRSGETPQLQIHPRRDRLGRFGLTMSDVQDFVSTALGGKAVGQLWEGDRSFDIVLRLAQSARETIERISELRIPAPGGKLVPLSAVVDVRLGIGRASIDRENSRRYVGLRMNVRDRDLGSFVDEARAAVRERVQMKPGMTVEWGGEFESKERAMNRLVVVVPVALVITFALLFHAFRSVLLAALVLVTVPFGLVGGALGLWIFEMPISIAAAVGFIALVGQASLNGVLVLSAVEERRRAGADLDQAILEGAGERLRAVLMTAALAALGLVPAAFSRAMGAETQRPIAVVIVGGTLSAALLTLIVLPVLYRSAMRISLRLRQRRPGGAVGR
jgi:cobalt-zinc-cadmium resistance protein CzcA